MVNYYGHIVYFGVYLNMTSASWFILNTDTSHAFLTFTHVLFN